MAQTKDRTYSFRAGADLDRRLQEATRRFAASDRRWSGEVGRAFERCLLTRLPELGPDPSDSALLRTMLESWITASERLLAEEQLLGTYRAWSAESEDGQEFRDGALRAGATLWDE